LTRDEALSRLKRSGSRRGVQDLTRYGIVAPRAFGVPINKLLALKKRIGTDRALAASLWNSGWYEARLLAAMVDDPKQVTRRQMDAWARAFDSWGLCDTVCWHLFDYTPFAFEKARQWSRSPREFVKRAAFALMAGQAGHNETATDAQLLALLPLIEKGARDERNFVKKGVSWALRRIGGRSRVLHEASLGLGRKLAASDDAHARWVGKEAVRDLSRPLVRARAARR
jgi:3-methyladenine DNA glycosylase AlkD